MSGAAGGGWKELGAGAVPEEEKAHWAGVEQGRGRMGRQPRPSTTNKGSEVPVHVELQPPCPGVSATSLRLWRSNHMNHSIAILNFIHFKSPYLGEWRISCKNLDIRSLVFESLF